MYGGGGQDRGGGQTKQAIGEKKCIVTSIILVLLEVFIPFQHFHVFQLHYSTAQYNNFIFLKLKAVVALKV